ncbi:hypothetical protein NO357_05060 [Marimonas arenosa]|uniref:Uncharacterized protein n=1 Tax=Marimonas arenosa TaxID=1795305 RepID=A0AAE3WCJ0_9RHOB|nr:hypothetical protein [Marimonas arenosa]
MPAAPPCHKARHPRRYDQQQADDLFPIPKSGDDNADSIEVIKGLETVHQRPGLHIGSIDDRLTGIKVSTGNIWENRYVRR